MIRPGSSCSITHNIIVGEKVAFQTGENVVVEQIAPNARRPENKYVVLSVALQERFQLKAEDLREKQDAPPRYEPETETEANKPPMEAGKIILLVLATFVTVFIVQFAWGYWIGFIVSLVIFLAIVCWRRFFGDLSDTARKQTGRNE
jgi:hypothetical protein